MSLSIRTVAALLICFISHGVAIAGTVPFGNMRVVPNPAVAGQPVSLVVLWSGCSPQGETEVSVSGNVVRVLQVDTTSICWAAPPPPHEETYPLGRFVAGSYTAQFVVDFATPGVPLEINEIPFVVRGALPSVALPATGPLVLGMLGLGLGLVGWLGLRRRARG